MSENGVAVGEPLVIVTDQDAVDAKIRSLQRDNPFQPDSPLSHQAEDIIKASTITRSFIEMHDPSVEGDSPRTDVDVPDAVEEEMTVATNASALQSAPPDPKDATPSPASPASDGPRSNGDAEPAAGDCSSQNDKLKKKKKKKGCVIL